MACKECIHVELCKKYHDPFTYDIVPSVGCDDFKDSKPKTNADHFREAISTEDRMAKFLMKVHDEGIYIPFCQNKKECWDECPAILDEKCMECMMQWLRKPYEGD